MGRIQRGFATLGLATVMALTGCGGEVGNSSTKSFSDSSTDTSSPETATYPTQTRKACDVLTARAAKAVLGSVGPASSPASETSSDDVSVSACVRANALSGLERTESASVLMRVARTEKGARSNESVFASGTLPAGAQDVSGYGEKAFWNPAFGQLNILSDGNWYILTAGPINPRQNTLADARKLADAIENKL